MSRRQESVTCTSHQSCRHRLTNDTDGRQTLPRTHDRTTTHVVLLHALWSTLFHRRLRDLTAATTLFWVKMLAVRLDCYKISAASRRLQDIDPNLHLLKTQLASRNMIFFFVLGWTDSASLLCGWHMIIMWNKTEIKLKPNIFPWVLFETLAQLKRNWNKTLKQLWNDFSVVQGSFAHISRMSTVFTWEWDMFKKIRVLETPPLA